MRILFIAATNDVQTATWIQQLSDTGWDIHVFDPDHGLLNSELHHVTVYAGWRKKKVPQNVKVVYRWPFTRARHFMQQNFPGVWKRIVPESKYLLAQIIQQIRPDCIHALGMQIYAYTLHEAMQVLGGSFPCPWIYTSKGSDMYWWGQFPEHRQKIEAILRDCNYYACNAERDVRLAREYGFQGELLGLFQGMGGYPLKKMQHLREPGETSQRRFIAVKGLQHQVGMGLIALRALELCTPLLSEYKIRVYQAHPPVREEVARLSSQYGLDVEVFGGGPQDMWRLFGQSRIALGVSRSECIPKAMVEAMIMGAFPIQTNPGGITAELVEDGVNGILIPDDNPEIVASALRRALQDDDLVNNAAPINERITAQRYDDAIVRPKVIEMYQRVVSSWQVSSK